MDDHATLTFTADHDNPSWDIFQSRPDHASWKVLSVEDDSIYQNSIRFALSQTRLLDHPVQFLAADSAREAADLIIQNPDIAVILLDVVMEDDEAGLRLISRIRDEIGNHAVRIILLSGQPGMARRQDILRRYDIDDCWNKSELTHEHLHTLISANLRTWEHLVRSEAAREGLVMAVDACQAISRSRDLDEFTQTVLDQLSRLIGVETGGVACIRQCDNARLEQATIVAASGSFDALTGARLGQVRRALPLDLFHEAVRIKSHLVAAGQYLFYFSDDDATPSEYLALVETKRQLTESEMNLLEIFTRNVSTGFRNVVLFNRMSELAYRDSVLDCANRNRLLLELSTLSPAAMLDAALVVMRIEHFRDIVLSFGEAFLHQLMGAVLRRLRAHIPDCFIACHQQGGFAIVVQSRRFAEDSFLEALFAKPMQIQNAHHTVYASFAVVPLQEKGDMPAPQVLSLAESTLDYACHRGETHRVYTSQLQQTISHSYTLLSDLRTALHRQQLYILLQPKVRLRDQVISGFEALVRWQHPDGHTVPPDEFIPVAETSGLISALGHQVVDATCEAIDQLDASGLRLPIAFNASGGELIRPDYCEQLLTFIRARGLDPSRFELEITESKAMESFEDVHPALRRLIDQGMRVSIDDFGTGYSSLSYVTRLAATTLKIDRTFISGIEYEDHGVDIIDMILQLSRRLNLDVVAEGIETSAQRRFLLDRGCQVGQGYYFARPMPVPEAIEWARAHRMPHLQSH